MPKLKTNRAAKKRFRKQGDSFKRKKAGHGHLLTKKTRKRKRGLTTIGTVSKADKKRVARLVPYV
jgi:large subunit ribosomal protein L35